MGEFFSAYWQVIVVFVNLLFVALLAVVASLIRLQFGQIADHQRRQDTELSALRKDVDELKGGTAIVSRDLQHLSELLEHYVAELKEQRERDMLENKERHKELRDALKDLKLMLATHPPVST